MEQQGEANTVLEKNFPSAPDPPIPQHGTVASGHFFVPTTVWRSTVEAHQNKPALRCNSCFLQAGRLRQQPNLTQIWGRVALGRGVPRCPSLALRFAPPEEPDPVRGCTFPAFGADSSATPPEIPPQSHPSPLSVVPSARKPQLGNCPLVAYERASTWTWWAIRVLSSAVLLERSILTTGVRLFGSSGRILCSVLVAVNSLPKVSMKC